MVDLATEVQQAELVGTIEREVQYGHGTGEISLDKRNDLLILDERTHRFVVCAGDLSLMFTGVSFPEWSEPESVEGMVFNLGSKGFEVAEAKGIEADSGLLWVPNSPVIVRFTGPASTLDFDRTINDNQSIRLNGPRPSQREHGAHYSDASAEVRTDSDRKHDYSFPFAEAALSELAAGMPEDSRVWINYTRNGGIAVRNTASYGVESDLRVIAVPEQY